MKNTQRFALAVMVFALMFSWAMPASAQTLYGSVVGQIEDPSGAAIVQATITLTNKATGQVYEGRLTKPDGSWCRTLCPATTI